jgi:hypothetical protein
VPYKSGNKPFDDQHALLEGQRQTSLLGATQVQARTAEITFYRGLLNAALANNVSASVFSQALRSLGVQT